MNARTDDNKVTTSAIFAANYDNKSVIADDDFNTWGVEGVSLRTVSISTSGHSYPLWINVELDYAVQYVR